MTKRAKYQIGAALLALGLLGACNIIKVQNDNDNQQAQGITTPSNAASPSPSAECALGSVQPGTAGDTREIAPGTSVGIGVSLFGPQGLLLVESCLSNYTPIWTTSSGPCTFVGSHNGVVTAPESATIGATCRGGVDVGEKHGELNLVVVGP